MALIHCKDTLVLYNEYNLSGYFKDVNAVMDVETAETTAFGASSKSYIVGHRGGNMSLSGMWDGGAGAVDAVLHPSLGNQSTDSVDDGHVMVIPTNTAGQPVWMMRADTTNYAITTPVADVASVSADFQCSGDGLRSGYLLLANTTNVTATGLSAYVDGLASSSAGAICQLHVTANNLNNTATIKIQSSTSSGGTYTDVTGAAFTTVATGNEVSERKSVASGVTINRYFKVHTTTSASSGAINFALAITRL